MDAFVAIRSVSIDHMYCNQIKHLLPTKFVTPLIATTTNKSDLVVIRKYYHK
jgi:hypothetical protein